jgi:hypothetical protein
MRQGQHRVGLGANELMLDVVHQAGERRASRRRQREAWIDPPWLRCVVDKHASPANKVIMDFGDLDVEYPRRGRLGRDRIDDAFEPRQQAMQQVAALQAGRRHPSAALDPKGVVHRRGDSQRAFTVDSDVNRDHRPVGVAEQPCHRPCDGRRPGEVPCPYEVADTDVFDRLRLAYASRAKGAHRDIRPRCTKDQRHAGQREAWSCRAVTRGATAGSRLARLA